MISILNDLMIVDSHALLKIDYCDLIDLFLFEEKKEF